MYVYFILVNYNNSKLTIDCIDSILDQKNVALEFVIKIIVVDNASGSNEIMLLKTWNEKNINKNVYFLFSSENLGYFKAFNFAFQSIEEKNKYVVIGNNDLIFDKSFVENLSKKTYEPSILILSPDIVTPAGIHQNPHVVNRISFIRRLFYKLYFINYEFAWCISQFMKLFKQSRQIVSRVGYDQEQLINMGFGACYILLPEFFSHFIMLDDRVFLMGEEALLSNQVHSCGGKILYTPSLKVKHIDHSTFKKIPSREKYEMTRKSYIIYKKYL